MPMSQLAFRPPITKSPSTEAAIRAVRDSRRSRRPGPELPNGRPFRYQGASPRQAPIESAFASPA